MKAYCVKEKKMVEMKNPREVRMKNGMRAMQGTCPKSGAKLFRILGK